MLSPDSVPFCVCPCPSCLNATFIVLFSAAQYSIPIILTVSELALSSLTPAAVLRKGFFLFFRGRKQGDMDSFR